MVKKLMTALLLTLVALTGPAQEHTGKKENKIALRGTVADGFTKASIPDVKAILMREDSTVIDTTQVYEGFGYMTGVGRTKGSTNYYFTISREPARYILKFEHPNYETVYADFEMKKVSRRLQDVEGPKVYLKKTASAHHFEGGSLDEVVVKATKVKMVWRGDTLVYNADAFNVPEGSMLDGLIKQLPGVELKDNGEIFVNGKKIDNLTLNGADFFKGKNKIMLENLPYFTVKNVEVYKKQTEENKFLGITDEDKKEYTMDVILKREYSIGGSANVEAGYGTDDRYKLKGFGLRFSDRTRAVLFGGMNNINESSSYDSWDSEYKDKSQQSGDRHFKQVGGQFVYQAPEEKLVNSTEVNATWNDDLTESRSQSETYLNDANSTFSRSESSNRSKTSAFSLQNTLRATSGKYRLYTNAYVNYNRGRNEGEGWNLSTADAVMHDSINSSWYRSRSQSDHLNGRGNATLTKRLPTGDTFELSLTGNFSRQFRPESSSQNHYTYFKLGTTDDRDRRTESPSHSYDYSGTLTYRYEVTKQMTLSPYIGLGTSDNHSDRHEYLRDSIDYLFDAQNSYEQATQTLYRRAGLSIHFYKMQKNYYFGLSSQLGANFRRECMNYASEPLTTSLTRNYTLLSPNAFFYLYTLDNTRELTAQYYMWPSTPSLTDLIDRPITSDPLNIFLGNADLKKSEQHYWNARYAIHSDSIDQNIGFNLNARLTHNARTQGYTYDLTTGVRTYRPENISSGNWSLGTTVNWNRALNKQKVWHIGNELRLNYDKSTGLALTTGSTSSELSRVGNMTLAYATNLRYQKGNLNLQAKGEVNYRHIHRNITVGEQPTDILDFNYGLNGTYKLPWEMTLDTDLTMHSRRGYTDAEMNDNRLYWDASLTKSFKQGRWVVKLRGYDLLGQVSSLRYYVNAQGRSETWTNSMRRYALLTVSYRFSQKPSKKD